MLGESSCLEHPFVSFRPFPRSAIGCIGDGRILLPLGLAVLSGHALAQTPPDAGTLQREAGQAIRQPDKPVAQPPLARPLDESAKGARVTVQRFEVVGASLIEASALTALLADQLGRPLSLAELEGAAQRIARHYRERGWYVRVYLPVQEVTGGVVRIQVVEGRYGGVRREDKGSRADGAFVQEMVTRGLTPGLPLPADALEQGLLRARELAGIRASGVLEAGEVPGTTRLLLQVDDAPLFGGDVGLNNHGVKATGRSQLVGGVGLDNLSGRGDRLSLRALAAERLSSAMVQYTLPVGSAGWRLGVQASVLDYRLGDAFRDLDAEGRAQTLMLRADHAWVRRNDRTLSLTAALERRRYDDDVLDEAARRQRVDAVSLGLQGDIVDGFGGGGFTWGNLQLVRGRLHLGDVVGDRAADGAGPRAAGDYAKLGFQLARLQQLGGDWQLLAMLGGQFANRNLASSERFSLGGPNGVRAYPVNEATGDDGLLLKLELQRRLGRGWQAQLFYDAGRIRQHHDTWAGWQGGSGQPNGYSLDGIGAGLSWQQAGSGGAFERWRLAALVATAVGGNPGAGADGHNNDGSRPAATRFWLSASTAF